MKKLLLMVVLVVFTGIFFNLGSNSKLEAAEDNTSDVVLITDVGKIDDHSFNEGSYNGVLDFVQETSHSYKYIQPSDESDAARIDAIKSAIEINKAKAVVLPGYLFQYPVYDLQDKYPDVNFILIDGIPTDAEGNPVAIAKNVYCFSFQEEIPGYLAGYAAVQDGFRKLGFIGGIALPAVKRYGYGYVLGAQQAAADLKLAKGDVEIYYNYAGSFSPSDEIKTKASSWYANGVDIIFSCGGGIYSSITDAAEAKSKSVIGVDTDQSALSSSFIVSAEKKLRKSVYDSLMVLENNAWAWDVAHAGVHDNLGIAGDYVGLSTESWKFENYTVAQYNEVYKKIQDGSIKITVDGTADDVPTTPLVTVSLSDPVASSSTNVGMIVGIIIAVVVVFALLIK